MYELLIRIETVCAGAPLLTLLGVGAVSIVVGLLLWLAGTYFSSVIVGVLGAAVGSFCGLLISQWFDVNSLLCMGIGAGVFCIAAVLLKNIIIIVLAMLGGLLIQVRFWEDLLNNRMHSWPLSQSAHSATWIQRCDYPT